MAEIVGIAAVARNRVIGSGNDIPWRISEDWRRFKDLTMGQVLVMGRKTYDSIGRPLPGRTTIVVTRDPEWSAVGVQSAPDLASAFRLAEDQDPEVIFVAGGGEIYRAAWDRMTRLELTEVDVEPEGDVTFPPLDDAWSETRCDERDGYRFRSYSRLG